MPVTARLSRQFYDRFGDEIADELVKWFNAVDETYRSDLRQLNELNFARFDAKLEQRLAEYDAKWERRFAEFELKWEKRFVELEAKWDKRFVELEARWERRFADLEVLIERRFVAQTRWMFVMWSTMMLAM